MRKVVDIYFYVKDCKSLLLKFDFTVCLCIVFSFNDN